jgi:hypothetical protein
MSNRVALAVEFPLGFPGGALHRKRMIPPPDQLPESFIWTAFGSWQEGAGHD